MILAHPKMSSDAENKEVSHAILHNPLISVFAVNLSRMTHHASLRPRLSGPFSSCAISQRVRPAKWVYARPHLVIVGCGGFQSVCQLLAGRDTVGTAYARRR